jgi:subtilisin-like proprotein convertase family protein
LCAFSWSDLAASGQRSDDQVWTVLEVGELESRRQAGAEPWIRPDRFAAAALEPSALDALLATAPMELTALAGEQPAVLTLPHPDGGFERFAVVESPVMHPDLERWMAAAGWPMKTYRGAGLDNPGNTLRFDWGGPAGFHAMVHSPDGGYFVDPYWKADRRLYASYFRIEYTLNGEGKAFRCEVESSDEPPAGSPESASARESLVPADTGGVLRTYRLAMAATGEYTAFHGGTQVAGQAAVTTTVNRVNMVYERDFSVRMTLVADNIDVIYTNGGSDPYSNNDCSAMLDENQANLDLEIGSANYDIGHVSGTGGGGIASLESPCNASRKAKGCTGGSMPIGDPFDIDFVAHEVGHQFGGNHTWVGLGGNCTAGAFASTAAYEPGSGSTIQAYAGICGSENLQLNSDDHFHRKSLDEMGTFINGAGSCFTTGGTINPNEPTADAGSDFTIPMGTPFELTGAGSDTDGDPLTFNWEQFDLGVQKPLSTGDDGVQPIFRSWPSTVDSTRVFPRLQDLAAGTLSPGETLPITDRTMNFKLTVRDNRSGGGREDEDAMTVTSSTAAGPFAVTAPNGGEDFASGSSQTVTWDVASTDGGAVNTANVDILLSADGGLTYPTILAASTPNDGTQGVTLPSNLSTTSGRIKVKGAGNIFFDISDGNFLVGALSQCESPALPLMDPGSVSDDMTITGGEDLADLNVTLDIDHSWVGDLIVTLEHIDTGTSVVMIDRPGIPASAQGCFNDDIRADLDDEATDPVEDECDTPVAIEGTFIPNNPLSAFDGEDVDGTWRLTIEDEFGGDGGTLNMWCLGGSFDLGGGGCSADIVLENQTLSGTQTFEATTTATLGPALIVDGDSIVVNAPGVSFVDGVEVRGTFQAGNSPSCVGGVLLGPVGTR